MTRVQKRVLLQTRIARHIAFAVVVSLVLSALVLVVFRHHSVRRNMERSARTYAQLISEPLTLLVEFLGSTGKGLLDQQVAQLRELNDDVERLEIVDVRGQVVLRAEGNNVILFGSGIESPTITDRELLRAIEGLEYTAMQVTEADGSDAYRVVAPVVGQWGEHVYSMVGTFTYANVDRQLRSSLWLSALILAAGLVLAHWVSVALAGGITRDVDRLRAGVMRIQEGRLEERVSINSRDEIEELADAFNLMADELVATIRQLRDANRELETLDQTKADLVANVSHELKTPLTALRGYLELMSEGGLGTVSEEAVRAVMVCRKNVERLSLRVEELVQLSRLDRFTALDSAREEIELGPILESVVDTFRPRMEGVDMRFVLQVQPDLHALEANPEQIERVFLNLLDNAVKFTPQGGSVLVFAEACDHEQRQGVLVRVQDSGVGIPPTELIRIFDRFYQVDPSSRRRFGGMGLGLSLVRSIVEAHLGAVWAESEEGIGSTFFVWLPSTEIGREAADEHGPSVRLEGADVDRRAVREV
jgi:signal transduction histidine kinase